MRTSLALAIAAGIFTPLVSAAQSQPVRTNDRVGTTDWPAHSRRGTEDAPTGAAPMQWADRMRRVTDTPSSRDLGLVAAALGSLGVASPDNQDTSVHSASVNKFNLLGLRDSYSGAGGQAQGGSVNGGGGLINIGSGNAGNGGNAGSGSAGAVLHGGPGPAKVNPTSSSDDSGGLINVVLGGHDDNHSGHLLGFLTRRSELSKLRNFDPRCGCEWNSSHDDGGDPNRGIIQGTQAQGHQDPAPESSPPPPPPPSSPTLEPTHDDSQPTKTDDDGDHHPSEDPAEPSPSSFIASNSVSPPPDAPAPPPDVVPPPPPPPPPTNATTTAAPPPQDPSADRTGGGDSPITITGAGGNANGGSVNGGGLINILSNNAGDGGKAGSGNAGGDANRAANGNYFSGAGGQAQGGSVNNPGADNAGDGGGAPAKGLLAGKLLPGILRRDSYTGAGGQANGGNVYGSSDSGALLNVLSNNGGDGGVASTGDARRAFSAKFSARDNSYSGAGGQANGGSVYGYGGLIPILAGNAGNGGDATSGDA